MRWRQFVGASVPSEAHDVHPRVSMIAGGTIFERFYREMGESDHCFRVGGFTWDTDWQENPSGVACVGEFCQP